MTTFMTETESTQKVTNPIPDIEKQSTHGSREGFPAGKYPRACMRCSILCLPTILAATLLICTYGRLEIVLLGIELTLSTNACAVWFASLPAI